MGVTFFGQYFLNRQVRVEQQVVLRGQSSMYQSRIQMTNPEIQYLELEDLQKEVQNINQQIRPPDLKKLFDERQIFDPTTQTITPSPAKTAATPADSAPSDAADAAPAPQTPASPEP